MKIHVVFMRDERQSITSRAIQWGLKRDYSHVAIMCEYRNRKNVLFHAIYPKVTLDTSLSYMKHRRIVKHYELDLKKLKKEYVEGYIDGSVGKEYATIQLFTNYLTKPLIRNGAKKVICSELVYRFLRDCGLDLKCDADGVDPRELEDKLIKHTGTNGNV